MTHSSKRNLFKKSYFLWVLLLLITGFWLYSLLLGPASRLGMARQLKAQYGQEFIVLSSQKVPGDRLGYCVYSARTFTAAPKDDPDLRFYASSYLATDGFWPVLHRYCNDNYMEEQMLHIWKEESQEAGQDYRLGYERHPCSYEERTFCSGYRIALDLTPKNLDQVCTLLSHTMERILAETPAEQGKAASFHFRLSYSGESWPDDDHCSMELALFFQLNHSDAGSVWGAVDTDPDAIRQYILDEAARHKNRKYSDS